MWQDQCDCIDQNIFSSIEQIPNYPDILIYSIFKYQYVYVFYIQQNIAEVVQNCLQTTIRFQLSNQLFVNLFSQETLNLQFDSILHQFLIVRFCQYQALEYRQPILLTNLSEQKKHPPSFQYFVNFDFKTSIYIIIYIIHHITPLYIYMQLLGCRQKYGMGNAYVYRKEVEDGLLQTIPDQITKKCRIKKILRTTINLLKINLFESALLGWLLKNSKFDVDRVQIVQNDGSKDRIYQDKVHRFIMLRGYQVKELLSSDSYASVQIDKQIYGNQPQFFKAYENWNPQKSLKDLTLKQINKIFEEWKQKNNNGNKTDYNSLVSKILVLSKTYNTDKDSGNTEANHKKKRKLIISDQNNEDDEDKQKNNQEKPNSIRLLRSSSRKTKLYHQYDQYPQELNYLLQEQYSDNMQLPLKRSTVRNSLPRTYSNMTAFNNNQPFCLKSSFQIYKRENINIQPVRSPTRDNIFKKTNSKTQQ